MLQLEDFTRIEVPGTYHAYFSHTLEDGREVCIEPCLNGFDIAIYNLDKDVIGEKTCTNMDGYQYQLIEAMKRAIEIVNQKLRDLDK